MYALQIYKLPMRPKIHMHQEDSPNNKIRHVDTCKITVWEVVIYNKLMNMTVCVLFILVKIYVC